jgi:hypothetical protein
MRLEKVTLVAGIGQAWEGLILVLLVALFVHGRLQRNPHLQTHDLKKHLDTQKRDIRILKHQAQTMETPMREINTTKKTLILQLLHQSKRLNFVDSLEISISILPRSERLALLASM